MRNINWNEIEEIKEYERLTAGGYICGITAVQDVEEKEYLKIEYDVVDGKFKNYFKDLYESKSFWGGSFIKSYKQRALPFFKAFVTSVEASNSGYKFNNDESTLRGKLVGLVLGEEEYYANDGQVKTRLYVADVHSVDKIKSGNFRVPAMKTLTPAQNNSSTDFVPANLASENLPWEN